MYVSKTAPRKIDRYFEYSYHFLFGYLLQMMYCIVYSNLIEGIEAKNRRFTPLSLLLYVFYTLELSQFGKFADLFLF